MLIRISCCSFEIQYTATLNTYKMSFTFIVGLHNRESKRCCPLHRLILRSDNLQGFHSPVNDCTRTQCSIITIRQFLCIDSCIPSHSHQASPLCFVLLEIVLQGLPMSPVKKFITLVSNSDVEHSCLVSTENINIRKNCFYLPFFKDTGKQKHRDTHTTCIHK